MGEAPGAQVPPAGAPSKAEPVLCCVTPQRDGRRHRGRRVKGPHLPGGNQPLERLGGVQRRGQACPPWQTPACLLLLNFTGDTKKGDANSTRVTGKNQLWFKPRHLCVFSIGSALPSCLRGWSCVSFFTWIHPMLRFLSSYWVCQS